MKTFSELEINGFMIPKNIDSPDLSALIVFPAKIQ